MGFKCFLWGFYTAGRKVGRKVEKIIERIIGRLFPHIFTSREDSGDFKFRIKIHVFP